MIVLYYIHFYYISGGSLLINLLLIFCSVYFIRLITVVGINKLFFMGLYVQVV